MGKDFQLAPMSDDVKAYFKRIYTSDTDEEAISYFISQNSTVNDRLQYYQNEIAAYENELQQSYGISDYYRIELEGKIYTYKHYVKVIETYKEKGGNK